MDLCFDQTGIYAVLMAARDMVCILVKMDMKKDDIKTMGRFDLFKSQCFSCSKSKNI